MAKSKVKAIADVQRPMLEAKNDFTPGNEYDFNKAISPVGRESIGTALDQEARIVLLAKNQFGKGNEYNVTD